VVTVSQRQPDRDIFGTARPTGPDELQFLDLSKLTRYDLLLAVIPVLLLVSWVLGHLSGVPVWATMAAGAFAALPLVADGLAVNPPT
jgi:hypothetical protein